jgi:ribonuclease E
MAKKMLIDATHAEETRVVVVDGNKVEEFDFESENKRQLAGNIYLAKVTRVEPSLQAAFVDYGGNRHGFLAFSEIHPDYYQIPVADREALLAEERAYSDTQRALENDEDVPKKPRRSNSRRNKAQSFKSKDAVDAKPVEPSDIIGMETIDFETEDEFKNVETRQISDESVTKTVADQISDASMEEQDQAVDASIDVSEQTAEEGHGEDDAIKDDSIQVADPDDDGVEAQGNSASAKDDSIEDVAEVDDDFDLLSIRKPRPRRYKIQEVVKMRQILLVQVVKEERGNKGAALTTYLSLAGRYCVLMPNTARGGGISRKITNVVDRKKLKEIAHSIDVPQGAGLIIRTAGAKRTKTEVKRDYEYLQRLWEQIRELTLKSIAPAKIYEEGDLIKRSIRDLYNREIDEVLVEGERGYRIAKDFMKMIMPSHAKNVQIYHDTMPLFARYQVESYLSSMFNPVVQLRSGGYIVIGITEALVAVDVNSGRATKEASIEETALKTNLEAAEEVARQLRLRDLAGLIVIDFIDMDERKNNTAVEKRMKDRLKTDRARIQIGRISGFGLMEMSRQRLRPGMLEATTQGCPHCHGTGLIRSEDSLALAILRQIEDEGARRRSREVLIKCPVSVANFLMNQKRDHISQIEARHGLSVRVEGIMTLISPEYEMEKFKHATRTILEPVETIVSGDPSMMADGSEVEENEQETDAVPNSQPEEFDGEENKPKKRRRRRRRRKSNGTSVNGEGSEETTSNQTANTEPFDTAHDVSTSEIVSAEEQFSDSPVVSKNSEDNSEESNKKPARRRRKRASQKDASEPSLEVIDTMDDQVASKQHVSDKEGIASQEPTNLVSADVEKFDLMGEKPKRKRVPRKRKVEAEMVPGLISNEVPVEVDVKLESKPKAAKPRTRKPKVVKEKAETSRAKPVSKASIDLVKETKEAVKAVESPAPMETHEQSNVAPEADKSRRRGWWSRGS